METIKNLLIDSLNGFSPKFIPFFLLQLLVAGLLSYALQKLLNRKFKEEILDKAPVLAIGLTVLVAITKYSLPFSVLAAAAIILLGVSRERGKDQLTGLFLVAMISIGCGVGSVFLTFLGAIILFTTIIFLPLKKDA
ncbi:MAG: hypothetical protein H6582_04655 [Crocinitomicaceae bacterium]|nr:hypothetical protein [Crocinitomicaceae bacterium]